MPGVTRSTKTKPSSTARGGVAEPGVAKTLAKPRKAPKPTQMSKIQRKNLQILAQNADRDYLDTNVMPFLFFAFKELLQEKPDRPLIFLAEKLREIDGNRPTLPIVWDVCPEDTQGPPARESASIQAASQTKPPPTPRC